MTGDDPHADRYDPPPAYVNGRAVSPPALERMLADQVEVTVTFGDGSAYAAVFGPCWADLGTVRETGLDPMLEVPADFAALPEVNHRAIGLRVYQRQAGGGLIAEPLGTIRTVTPGEALGARYAALAAQRAALIAGGVPPAVLAERVAPGGGLSPGELAAGLRAAVADGLGWQVTAAAARVLLGMIDDGGRW
jgi:hypothetical protein